MPRTLKKEESDADSGPPVSDNKTLRFQRVMPRFQASQDIKQELRGSLEERKARPKLEDLTHTVGRMNGSNIIFENGEDNFGNSVEVAGDKHSRPSPAHMQHNGKSSRQVEVLLPRWQDVRRQNARLARVQSSVLPSHDSDVDVNGVAPLKEEHMEDIKVPFNLDGHNSEEASRILHTAVEKMRNPDVKVKKELLLDDKFILDALSWEDINHKYPIPLPPEIAEYRFSRAYISNLYGGNLQETFPKPRKDLVEWHGLNDWMFLSLDFNPHAPTRPGYSGLFFSSQRATKEWDTIERCFVRVRPSEWMYMGQYKMAPGMSLTTAAWKEQKETVRRAWARGIMLKEWGTGSATRIWLRKQHGANYIITEDDHKLDDGVIRQIRTSLTEEEIIAAFDRGEEEIGTWRMTCVGYDADFIRVLARNAPAWSSQKERQSAQRTSRGKRARRGLKA